jgi:molybdenum cofactor cytidylyltransferase
MQAVASKPIVGVLLAAGRGSRFDASGASSKLLQPLPAGPHRGRPVAQAAALNLRAAVDRVLAVVRPGDDARLYDALAQAGCDLVINPQADTGMGSSIACGIQASADAGGWLISLADMPAIAPATIARVATALRAGAMAVVPVVHGQRGHPVGFSAALAAQLTALQGDQGARAVLQAAAPLLLDVDDAGCLLDLDTAADFAALATRGN